MTMILNLGCGTKTSPLTVNIDWSIYLRMKKHPLGRRIAPRVLRGIRREQYLSLDNNLVIHDLRKGIPAPDSSVDAVYHSHVLEHIARDAVAGFLVEIRRVLKPGGVHRVVVPDWEGHARDYLASLERGLSEPAGRREHDTEVARMIIQMVRDEASGTSQQPRLQRKVENVLLGSARKRGEVHRWMWDRVNLQVILEEAGFRDIEVVDWQTSRIPNWNDTGLDRGASGTEYKPESLYIEAVK